MTTKDQTGSMLSKEKLSLVFQERSGKPGGGKGILITYEKTGALTANMKQYVLPGTEVLNG